MPHELLYRGEVDAVHYKVAGIGVSEGAELGQGLDLGFLGCPDQLAAELLLDLATIPARENKIALEALFVFILQFFQQIPGTLVDRDLPLPRLGLPKVLAVDLDLLPLEVNV